MSVDSFYFVSRLIARDKKYLKVLWKPHHDREIIRERGENWKEMANEYKWQIVLDYGDQVHCFPDFVFY